MSREEPPSDADNDPLPLPPRNPYVDFTTANQMPLPEHAVRTSGQPAPFQWRKRSERLLVTSRWLFLAAAVGVLAGLGAVVFFTLSEWAVESWLGDLGRHNPVKPRGESGDLLSSFDYVGVAINPWMCVLLPGIGGLVVGWLVMKFEPSASGPGTDHVIASYHQGKGYLPGRVVWVKTIASAITLGTGGSGGREGPAAEIGAGFGSWLAGVLRLSHRERRILLAVGMGAGVSAIFRAPLAGALFAAEILYRDPDFESEVIMPSLFGCIISYSIFTAFHKQGSLFAVRESANAHHFSFQHGGELIPYLVLGLVLVVFVYLYIRAFQTIGQRFARWKLAPQWKPMMGGLMTGALALILWKGTGDGRALSVLSFGYSALQESLDLSLDGIGQSEAWYLAGIFLLMAIGKILTTCFTVGSGGSAGVFGPSMVIGGAIGTAVGLFFHATCPELAPHPGAFTIVAMAGFFTGVANVPISTLLMVSEITGDYALLVPAMGVCAVTSSICRNMSVYGSQVGTRKDSPAHRGEFIKDVLEGMQVHDVLDRMRAANPVISTTSLRTLMELLPYRHSHYYPVINEAEQLVGIFTTNDIQPYIHDRSVWDLMVAADVMTSPVIAVTPADDLSSVLRRFTRKNLEEIPVVDEVDNGELLGMLRRREVIDAYNQQVVIQGLDDDETP